MRHSVPALGFVLLGLGVCSIAWTQEAPKPHLELVRGLRKEGMSDLALQYLEKLRTANLDAETALLLDVEFARTWLDMANDEQDESKRNALISQAKQMLDAFVKANPKHDRALDVNIDLARLYAVRGKALIRKARRLEDKKQLEAEMVEARKPLLEAAERFRQTAAELEKRVKSLEGSKAPADEKRRRDLLQHQLQASLDEGITLYSLAESNIGEDTKDIRAQGEQFKAAQKIFERVMYTDEKLPICWVAYAWASQAQMKAGDGARAERTMKDLMEKKGNPVAAAGIRVGRYFTILNTSDDVSKLAKETEAWLSDYPAFRDTPEGLGCRYLLAVSRRNLAFAAVKPKDGKITAIPPASRQQLEGAQRLFKELADSDNEYSERASRNRAQILIALADADGGGDAPPLESLPNFERAYLVAQVQIARFVQFRNGDGKSQPDEAAVKKEEHRRYSNALRYAEHALRLASGKDNPRDVFAAQLFLASCYNEMKMYPQAALLAEHLARENPKMPKAGAAASFAVGAYNRAQADLRRLKEKVDLPEGDVERQKVEKVWDSKFRADVARMQQAANFVISNWPDEASTDEARHLVAFYAARDQKYEDAWKAYAGIRNSYPGVQAARLELASIMFTMVYPTEEKDPARFQQAAADNIKKHEKQWKTTLSLLEGTPAPAGDAPAGDALRYVNSRAQLARMYQLEGSFLKSEKAASAMVKDVGRYKNITADQRTELRQTGQNLVLGAARAEAYKEFKAGNHPKVAELLDPRVAEIEKEFATKQTADDPTVTLTRLRRTQRETLVLALQSCVQDGKIKRAGELLDLLDKSGGSAEESMAMMQTLVAGVREQIEELEAAVKKATDERNPREAAARAKEAEALKAGFGELLGKLAAQGDALPLKTRLFLAQGLGSVKAYDKAAAEFEKIRKMPRPQEPKEPAADAPEEQQAQYRRDLDSFQNFTSYKRRAEYMLARNYWHAHDYPKAMTVFDEIIGKVNDKGPTPKEKQGWAFASLAVRKDKAMMLEEIASAAGQVNRLPKWGDAVKEWIGIARTFAPRLEPIRQNLAPEDEGKKILLTAFTARDLDPDANENQFSLARLAWFGHQYGKVWDDERKKAAAVSQEVAAKRDRYFDLFFEQKRCSVMAYKSLGLDAVKGDADKLKEKWTAFAKDFKDFTDKTKNPDLSQELRTKVKQLIDSVPELKREWDTLNR